VSTKNENPLANDEYSVDIFGATLTRSKFVKGAGGMIVGVALVGSGLGARAAKAATTTATASTPAVPLLPGTAHSPDPSQYGAWFTINPDNTIWMHTGRAEMGQGSASTALAQIAAEEFNVQYSTITQVFMGDTDRTPDGGGSFGYMGLGGPNIRNAAAYTYQALLSLASTQLGVPVANLTVTNGVISGGGKQVTYGQLVSGQQLKLTIPVFGDPTSFLGLFVIGGPPVKPPSQYQIVGQSIPMRTIPPIVSGTATYVGDVRLDGMVHGRPVHPPTIGAQLVSVGTLDKKQFPNTQVVVKGNFVGVVDPVEYTAIEAASTLARSTKWTSWEGLPGSGNTFKFMRTMDWTSIPPSYGVNVGNINAGLASAAKTFSATYEFPFAKHAGIGPTCAVADCRADGTVWVHAHGQNVSQGRAQFAKMLGVPLDNVTVRWYDGSGQYGRGNGGNTGAEEEAVILSKAVGKPVRVQWGRQDDMAWSTQHAPVISDVRAGLDANGNVVAFDARFYQPGVQDDRPVGAVLAGLPHQDAPTATGPEQYKTLVNPVSDTWLYTKVPNALQTGFGTYQIGQTTPSDPSYNQQIGMRTHSMRTPQQRQQNFAQESMMSELAAIANMDPIDFRIQNTNDKRLINVLNEVKSQSGWTSRPSPNPTASTAGSKKALIGQGCAAMNRGAYWACVAHVSVDPHTGKVRVLDITTVADVGLVVNPRQLKRMAEGGAVMGTSEALHEQVVFNKGAITSVDWVTFPILRFTELPKITVIVLPNPSGASAPGGGGEGPNGFVAAAIANAIFDATGRQPRRVPFLPGYIRNLLAT
jgi:CO/xanthine dehydrogenase Mo-binding subunit